MNARAFEIATETWQESGNLRRSVPPAAATWRPFVFRPAVMLMVIATVILLGAILLLPQRGVSTGIGEQRTLTLEDGTQITLNTATRVVVSYDRKARRVELKEGEALFDVAKRPDWPFIVTAGDRQVKALGTSFVVRHEAHELVVTLVEGKVAVVPSSGPGGLVLAPGERVSYEPRRATRLDHPDLDKALAWRRGLVILDDTPLAIAVEEMNRYSPLHLAVERPETGAVLVNGLFQTGDSKTFAEATAQIYGLQVVTRDDKILLTGTPKYSGLDAGPERP